MNLIFLGIMAGVFSVVQISIWNMFPPKIKDILLANPILAFLINLAGSNLIVAFTGVASMVGAANLFASVVFGVYAFIYKWRNGILGLKFCWKKFLRIFPIIPCLEVVYQRNK